MGLAPCLEGAPVVHFGEWSTSFPEKGGIPAKVPKKRELVVHFLEWSTSFPEKGGNQAKVPKYRELVVHFGKWTTGYPGNGGIPGICLEKA